MNLDHQISHSSSPQQKRSMFLVIFFTEILERFSFNGLYAVLGSYMASTYFTQSQAISFVTTLAALVSLNTFIGGYIADKWIGLRRSLAVGACILFLGYMLMLISYFLYCSKFTSFYNSSKLHTDIIPFPIFILIFTLLAVGNGIFKPATANMTALIYQGHPSLQSIITFSYIGVNIGSLFGIILSSNLDSLVFVMSPITFFIGFLYFMLNYHRLKLGSKLDHYKINYSYSVIGFMFILGITSFMLFYYSLSYGFVLSAFFLAFFWMIYCTFKLENTSQKFIQYVGIFLLCETIFFAIGFNTHINLFPFFAERHTNLQLLGFIVPKTLYTACNFLWLIILGPIACWLFNTRLKDVPISYLYSVGTIIMGSAFLMLAIITKQHITSMDYISGNWLLVAHGIMALAELAINTVVLTVVVKFFDVNLTTSAIGLSSILHSLGAALTGKLSYSVSQASQSQDIQKSLILYQSYFQNIAFLFIIAGIMFYVIASWIEQRLQQEKFYEVN